MNINNEQEIWRDIKGFEGYYQISNLGRVKSLQRFSVQNHLLPERIMSINHSFGGYCDVSLCIDGKRYHKKVHRLVAEAFVENPRNLNEVDHIDTNKDNNRYDNLRWVTHSENHLNPLTVELKKKKLTGRKLSEEQVYKMRTRIGVYKDGILLHKFDSYKDLDLNSKEIFGVQLWNVYVRRYINGELDYYKGYDYKILD